MGDDWGGVLYVCCVRPSLWISRREDAVLMTQTHRFTEPTRVFDLAQLRRVPVEQCNDIQIVTDEEYEAWLDERWADHWELAE